MAVFELKSPVMSGAIGALEELLAEQAETRWMIVEDKTLALAWLAGYFESPAEGQEAWKEFFETCPAGLLTPELSISELPDTEWKDSYKIHFKAWKFGDLNWVPVWERGTFVLPAGEKVLWLDPGMAFGTGNHETTRLVVERLVDFRRRRGPQGCVIDAGCGSGILALSAVKLGFNGVVAFDLDSEAVRVSEANARLNDLVGTVSFVVGDLVAGLNGRHADLLLANIQSDILVREAHRLVAAVRPAGELVLSGILAKELPQVAAAFGKVAPDWRTESRGMGEWSDLALRRD